MKVCVLASGSKGNSTYIEYKDTKILIDLGMSCSYIEQKLKEIGVEAKAIDAIFITHTHSDHINGLKVFLKKYHTNVYLTQTMLDDIVLTFPLKRYILIDGNFEIKDLFVEVIKISHDASDTNGYILYGDDKSVVYITDTGYINFKNHNKLKNKTVYIMESNHDVQMLMDGNRPYYLKQRILSDKGHLSNQASSDYLTKFIGKNTKKIILAHLSQDNNTPEKALQCLQQKLLEEDKTVDKIIVASQNEKTELVEI